ncbi:MAG: hypothetical protein AAFP84_07890, partial [Actinomycetota bacterium]
AASVAPPSAVAVAASATPANAVHCDFVDIQQELDAFSTTQARHTATFKFCYGSTPTVEVVAHDADKVGVFGAFIKDITIQVTGDPTRWVKAEATAEACGSPAHELCVDVEHEFTAYATPTGPPYVSNPGW